MLEYIVVCRAQSGILLKRDDFLGVNVPGTVGSIQLLLKTRYRNIPGFSGPVPWGLMVEARGFAASATEATEAFSKLAQSLCPILVLAGNAPIEDVIPEIAYESTSGVTEREYFQHFLPETPHPPLQQRRLEGPLLARIFEKLRGHTERVRLRRAIGHYYHALRNWEPGHSTFALVHLWMALEALTPIALRRELSEKKVTRAELLTDWAVEDKNLDAEVRRRILFKGDDATYRAARHANNGFKHGSLEFDEVMDNADAVRDALATYVRDAILGFLNLEPDDVLNLTSAAYKTPTHLRLTKILRAVLVGDSSTLAAAGFDHPHVNWRTQYAEGEGSTPGELQFVHRETLTPQIAEGLSLRITQFEAHGGEGLDLKPASSTTNPLGSGRQA